MSWKQRLIKQRVSEGGKVQMTPGASEITHEYTDNRTGPRAKIKRKAEWEILGKDNEVR